VKALIAYRYLIIFILLVATPLPFGAAASQEGPYRDKIVAFFESLMKGDVEGSYRNMVSKSLIQGKPKELSVLISQTKNALTVYGDIFDYKHLETECKGESLCISRYVSLCKNYPMLWSFIFYENQEGWILLNISFNDDIKSIFNRE
jgi:hypothetical protein